MYSKAFLTSFKCQIRLVWSRPKPLKHLTRIVAGWYVEDCSPYMWEGIDAWESSNWCHGLLEYVLREADTELCSLVRPLFTHRKLVIWTNDHHSTPVLDLRSLLEPFGVEFIDHTLYPECRFFCHCDGKHSLQVLNEENVLEMSLSLMELFQKAYSTNNSGSARVDAFAMFHCSSQYEMFRFYNKSIISIATLRYETCRKPKYGMS